jgi:hypothetical protein
MQRACARSTPTPNRWRYAPAPAPCLPLTTQRKHGLWKVPRLMETADQTRAARVAALRCPQSAVSTGACKPAPGPAVLYHRGAPLARPFPMEGSARTPHPLKRGGWSAGRLGRAGVRRVTGTDVAGGEVDGALDSALLHPVETANGLAIESDPARLLLHDVSPLRRVCVGCSWRLSTYRGEGRAS